MNKSLTVKQKLVLATIQDLKAKLGNPPTLEEIRKALDYSGTSSVQRHTDVLKEKGYLENTRGLSFPASNEQVQIPLIGNVACGAPLLATENIEAYIPYPTLKTKYSVDDLFFLRAIGDSMNKSDINGKTINDGDYVLVRKTSTPEYGKRVVALIGDEATIKKLKLESDHIVLEPESTNPANKPIYIFDEILIQGIVVDVLKYGKK